MFLGHSRPYFRREETIFEDSVSPKQNDVLQITQRYTKIHVILDKGWPFAERKPGLNQYLRLVRDTWGRKHVYGVV